MASIYSYELLDREGLVYPGHPCVIAYMILKKYESYEKAIERSPGAGYPMALVDGDISGAGGNVYAALDILKAIVEKGPEEAFSQGEAAWERCVGPGTGNIESAFIPGQEQAEKFRERFMNAAAMWHEPTRQATELSTATPSAPSLRPKSRI